MIARVSQKKIVHIVTITIAAVWMLQTANGQSMGKVAGRVIDPKGAVVVSAIVIVNSEQIKQRTVTNNIGAYEFQLPPGLYHLTTDIPGYYPYRRSTFRVQPAIVTTINIAPVLHVLSIGIEVTSSGSREPITTAPSAKYESFSPSASAPLDLLVRFNKRRKHQNCIAYTRVMISFDSLTIYADRARLCPNTLRAQVQNNVVVENGEDYVRANLVNIEFKDKMHFEVIR
ncbi:MAG: hypothetical protein QOF62_1355 [Pyrinomonadaceae bacterium]|jgi:hypothetical protein|nr:hypothetical protein [Pyrinomonadaceae bacterium]